MLVSIIIPLYNAGHFIAQTIQSALDQTHPDIEIIVVDDGSKDAGYDIAKSFERYINVRVYRQKNSGSSATRNSGFAKSTGDYIQYLDADDLLSPDKIKDQLALLSSAGDGYIASCGWGKFSNTPSEATFVKQDVWKDMQPVQWLTSAWMGGGMMQTSCWLTPRALITAAGPWDESMQQNPNDDGEFFCRVLLKSKGIKFSEKAKVYYRVHEGARVSANKSYNAVHSLLQTCISYEEQILQRDSSPEVKNAVAYNYAAFAYLYIHQYPELAKIAQEKLADYNKVKGLGNVGGDNFNKLSAVLGFNNALAITNTLRKIVKR